MYFIIKRKLAVMLHDPSLNFADFHLTKGQNLDLNTGLLPYPMFKVSVFI